MESFSLDSTQRKIFETFPVNKKEQPREREEGTWKEKEENKKERKKKKTPKIDQKCGKGKRKRNKMGETLGGVRKKAIGK